MKKRVEFEAYFLGIIFLLSGFIKSTDTTLFMQTIAMYGIGYIEYAAPVIVIAEIYMGLSFLTQKNKFFTSIISLSFLLFVSVIFLYGLIFKDITDCGCFGKLQLFNNAPWFTIIRNIVLVLLCIDIIYNCRKSGIKAEWPSLETIITICIIATGAFTCGHSTKFKKIASGSRGFEPKYIKETKLNDYITTSPDSTYLVFAFSYTCPHCVNSIGNLSQYERTGVVDKVISLTARNEKAQAVFNDFFEPDFEIIEFSKDSMLKLTRELPVSYYIRNDSIIDVFKGELPSAFLFKTLYLQNKE